MNVGKRATPHTAVMRIGTLIVNTDWGMRWHTPCVLAGYGSGSILANRTAIDTQSVSRAIEFAASAANTARHDRAVRSGTDHASAPAELVARRRHAVLRCAC